MKSPKSAMRSQRKSGNGMHRDSATGQNMSLGNILSQTVENGCPPSCFMVVLVAFRTA
jgi:hypothetical protein